MGRREVDLEGGKWFFRKREGRKQKKRGVKKAVKIGRNRKKEGQ